MTTYTIVRFYNGLIMKYPRKIADLETAIQKVRLLALNDPIKKHIRESCTYDDYEKQGSRFYRMGVRYWYEIKKRPLSRPYVYWRIYEDEATMEVLDDRYKIESP